MTTSIYKLLRFKRRRGTSVQNLSQEVGMTKNGFYNINSTIHSDKNVFNRLFSKEKQTTEAPKKPSNKREKEKSSDSFTTLDLFQTTIDIICVSGRGEVVYMLVGTICAILSGAMTPLMSVVFGDSANVFLDQESLEKLPVCTNLTHSTHCIPKDRLDEQRHEFKAAMQLYVIKYLIVFAIAFVTTFLQMYCWERASDGVVLRLRKDYLSHLLRQELTWFDTNMAGDLASRLTDDLERMRDGLGSRVPVLIQCVSLLVIGQAVAFWRSWRLSLVLLPGLPLLATCIALVASIGSKSSHREQLRYGVAGGIASQALVGIRTLSAFGAEASFIARYSKALEEGRKMTLPKHYALASLTGLINLLSFGLYSLGFWYGSTLFLSGRLSPGAILTILYCILQAGLTFGGNLVAIIDTSTALALSRSVLRVISRVPAIDSRSDAGPAPTLKGHISFNNVHFSYPTAPETQVLKGVNLEIECGRVVALVGASGGGKSSLISLLLRLYDPTSGTILLDGRELRELNVKSVRSQMGFVSQEPVLFDTTVRENIRYGLPGATDHQVEQAARAANAHNFILKLHRGYDSMVGERGGRLSGGQRQRVAIARALIRDPAVLLLDEATSALDSESEALVQEALQRAAQGRTVLVIAHRLATIRTADLICVIEDGKIVERGSHDELLALEGHYHHLLLSQQRNPPASHQHRKEALIEDNDETVEVVNRRKISIKSTKSEKSKTGVVRKVSAAVEKSSELAAGMFRLSGPPRGLLAAMLVGCLVSGLLVPVFAIVYSHVVEMFLLSGKDFGKKLALWQGVILAMALISCLSYFTSLVGSCLATERMIQTIRSETFGNIIRQRVSWFDGQHHSALRLTQTLARDPPQIKAVAGPRACSLVTGVLNLILAVGIALASDYRLAGLCCLIYPILTVLSHRQTRLRYINFAKEDSKIKLAAKVGSECVLNIRTVQTLGLEDTLVEQYCHLVDQASKSAGCQALMYASIYSLSSTIIYLVYVVTSQYGAHLLVSHRITLVDLLRILFEVSFTAPVIGMACNFAQDFVKGKKAVASLVKLRSIPSTLDPFTSVGYDADVVGRVEMRNVEFSYPGDSEAAVLRGIDLSAAPGQRVAVVGPSGSGKSTLLSLLERFYDPDKGTIMVDGVNIENWSVGRLRAGMALVSQESLLFDGTIADNILIGAVPDRPPPSQQDMISAAMDANIHDFIISLPQGYETLVGRGGVDLSGGQRQRVAIARALIRNPAILLLDEATSALDSHSEKQVEEALERASRGRTTLVIAHRLSTVRSADAIVVLQDGKVVERGTHDQLVSARGRYYDMTRSQLMEPHH